MRDRRESIGPIATVTLCLCVIAALVGAAAGWLVAGAVIAAGVAVLRRLGAVIVRLQPPRWLARLERVGLAEPRLSAGVQRAIDLAHEEARHFHQYHVGTEHLLLGLMRAGGHAASARPACGVDARIAHPRGGCGRGTRNGRGGAEPIPRPAARLVIEAAADRARNLNARVVTSRHLLTALAAGTHGTAAAVLESLGCTPAALAAALRSTWQRGDD